METRRRTAVLALALALPTAARAAPMVALAIECDPLGVVGASDGYADSTGFTWTGDSFAVCESPAFWTGVGDVHVEPPFTWDAQGTITSDGASVTSLVSIELGFPEGEWASMLVATQAAGRFRAPPGTTVAPAKIVFEVERSGLPLEEAGLWASVTGPGIDLQTSFQGLPDGVHASDVLLESDASYAVFVVSSGRLTQAGSGSQRLRLSVLAPEPAPPLLALVGAAALAVTGARRRPPALSRSAAASRRGRSRRPQS